MSRATASRALSGKPKVSAAAARAVFAAARRLNYRVDPIARALRERTTRTVGMVVPVISNPFFAELVGAVERELHPHGRELILADSHGHVAQEAARLRVLVERRVDAVILIPTHRRESAAAVRDCLTHVPLIQLDRRVDGPVTDFVGTDNRVGMELVVAHLVQVGATSAVLVSADDENSVGRARRTLFEAAARRGGLRTGPGVFHGFSVKHGRAAAGVLLDRPALPDAIVAGSDEIAFGLISALAENGVEVPRDVLVVGYDGTRMAEIYRPPLTTVRQPVDELAAGAVDRLLSRLGAPETEAGALECSPVLLARESTRRP